MKKKTYERPEIQVVEMCAADIICTSGDTANFQKYDEDDNTFNGGW